MMQRREALVCAFSLIAFSGASLRIVCGCGMLAERTASSYALTPTTPSVDDDSLAEAAANAAANDPFRLVNRPSTVRFDSKNEAGTPGAMPTFTPPRPQLFVKAIVGGPPWHAIVDGIPGEQPGTIVKTGDHFDKLTVRSVGRDTVVMQAPDTTWKLTLERDRS